MSMNVYTSTQRVLDAYNAAFQNEVPYLSYANTEIVNRTQEWEVGQFGVGTTVQVRRRPTTEGVTLDPSQFNGAITKTVQYVEMETIDVPIEKFFYANFLINTVNEKFYLNNNVVDDETIRAAVGSQKNQVTGYIYEKLLLKSRILSGSPSTTLGNQTSLGRICEKARLHNMPDLGCLLTSLRAGTDIQASFGPYFNTKASNPALSADKPTLGYFGNLQSYHNVKQFKTGDAVTDNGTTTVATAITNGATTIDLENMTPGAIIRVGSPLEFDSPNVRSVGRSEFNIISLLEDKPSFIVATSPVGTADFTAGPPPGENSNFTFLDNVEGYYTVPGGGALTIPVTTAIKTSGNFRVVDAPANTIPVGTFVNFFGDHVAGNYITRSGISWASPKLKRIDNATVKWSDGKGVSLRWASQGSLETETNRNELACLYGAGMDEAYLIRVMSNN